MKNLQELMKNTKEIAERNTFALRTGDSPDLTEEYGATKGQVLWVNEGKLEMTPCWLEIRVIRRWVNEKYEVNLRPLLPAIKQLNYDAYLVGQALDDQALNVLTDWRYSFGGETIRFRRHAYSRVKRAQDAEDIETQLRSCAAETIPAFRHKVCEIHGDLVIIGRDVFEIGRAVDSFMDGRDRFIRKYNELSWNQPSRERTDDNCGESERDELLQWLHTTTYTTSIVPTIWVKDSKRCELFFSFATNWRQSQYGDQITGRVGNFIVAHTLRRNGLLVTMTTLREQDSYWGLSAS